MNIHTHHAGEGINILDVSDGRAWGEEEEEGREVFYSVGVHPMSLGVSGVDVFAWMRDALRAEKVIAIGECGLDRRSPVRIEEQERVLEVQVAWAEEARMPLIIHCVKAYPELIAARKRTRSTVPWIVHGYNNNERIARQLLDHGFYISMGAALLNPLTNASRLLRDIPSGSLFLENDDKEVDIRVVYEAASGILGLDVEAVKEITWRNFNKIFVK